MASEEGERCLQNVRTNSLEGISDTLREYRRILLRLKHSSSHVTKADLNVRLRLLFRYLEYLKTAHLQLALVKSLQLTVIFLEQLKNKLFIM